MEGTVTISLSEYNEMRDSITELQSQVEKYAEQIQKEQLEYIVFRNSVICEFIELSVKPKKFYVSIENKNKLLDIGIKYKEIEECLARFNT